MSGIAGMYFLDHQPVQRTDLQRMVSSLGRRGPDRAGVWCEGSVGLAHCMLWTTPESLRETLPSTNATGDVVITADARIDNRDELFTTLGISDRPHEAISDSELILAAYEKWGENCPARLLGDFAFAVWDRHKQVLFCSRDHFGVRPLYYYCTAQVIVFASEIKALLSLRIVPRRINEARIADYLVAELEGIDKTCTFYQDIVRLPPGHSLTVGRVKTCLRPYWSLTPMDEIRYSSDADYAAAFREVFTEAVRCRLRSAFLPASMLSGGLDSSSIACVARDLLAKDGRPRLHTFSALSRDHAECAETWHVHAVLKTRGFESHTVRADELSAFTPDLRYVLWHTDDLFDHWITLPRLLYVAARMQGARILLDGVDGDVVASQGGDYLAHLLRSGMWRTAVVEAIGASEFYRHYYSPWGLLCSSGLSALKPYVPLPLLALRRWLRGTDRLRTMTKESVINVDFARRINLRERLETLRRNHDTTLDKNLREAHASALNSPYITVGLERYERAAASYSIEPGHPFFDKRLIEFCTALPWEQKIHRGWSKVSLRRAMAEVAPAEVCWRRGREHLGRDFTRSLLTLEGELIENIVSNHLEDIGEYVDTGAVREAYHRYVSRGTFEAGAAVWEAVTLAVWLRGDRMTVQADRTVEHSGCSGSTSGR